MRLLVIGHGGHGKGTACRLICDALGLSSMSSSEAAASAIFSQIQKALPRRYMTVSQAHADRRNHRQLWADLISEYNTPDKARLARLLLSQADVYDGMRMPDEYEAAKHLFNHVVWVDARYRGVPRDPTMLIEYTRREMEYLDNNQDKRQLADKVARLVGRIRNEPRAE